MRICKLCKEKEATEGNYCLRCAKIVNDTILDRYVEEDESIIISDTEFGKRKR